MVAVGRVPSRWCIIVHGLVGDPTGSAQNHATYNRREPPRSDDNADNRRPGTGTRAWCHLWCHHRARVTNTRGMGPCSPSYAPPTTGIRVGNVSSGVSDTPEPRIHTHGGWCPSTRLTGSRYRPPHCCAKRAMTALNRISNTTGPRGDLQRATCRIEFPVSTRVPTSSLDSSLQRKPFGDSQATDPTNPINCCQGLLFDVIVDNRN